ncbi:MAG TPA: LLM class flavin-dependent oxidoreductase [Candidatus Acidoferrales bacterium]|jgi:1,4-dihydroxy-2-naphthoate octaprenyltransferase|nr:LLM class flavin-dependent oxidoreductase [Candidatus Acidoferrales bacterium]
MITIIVGMSELNRPVGLGLAARGDVRETVNWVARAERAGLESVWVHDSYFERDPISFLAPMAQATKRIRLGAGALNPYTRHPFVVATTMASLDNIAEGRLSLALGSGLPLRLAQMNIPFENAPQRVGESIDQIRTLWRGERLVLNDRVPPLVPMFPPPKRIPIYIAAYTRPYLELAGEKADGYLARPMESVAAFTLMRERVLDSAERHARDASQIDFRGYLLTYISDSRQDALNRAKREPFVIYMISILSDISMSRAGFPRELRDRVNELWRAEDYHHAAEAIPDELLEAFVLAGTRHDVAARALDYRRAGMTVPLLQPVVQDEDQVMATIDACVLYGSETVNQASVAANREQVATGGADARRGFSVRERLQGIFEITRPFSFSASLVPVALGGAFAWTQGAVNPAAFFVALAAGLALHAGTNVINEIYDVRHGIDSITSPRASHAIVKGRVTEKQAFALAATCFAVAGALGLYLVFVRGPLMLALGALGVLGGYFYTAPPFQYKYRALGVPLVFLQMGVLMTVGGYFAASGRFDWRVVVLSIPAGLLVAAILHGNEWRDITEDLRLGFTTLSGELGKRAAYGTYVALVLGAYLVLTLAIILRIAPTLALLAMFSLPAAWWVLRAAERGYSGSTGDINTIDVMTARVHGVFSGLFLAGIAFSSLLK